jgi:hypothetical protein
VAKSVTTFAARRRRSIFLTLIAALLTTALVSSYSLSLHDTAYWSGWFLFAAMLFLTSYNARKKLTYPPLGRSATWLQLHVYLGLFTVLLFGLHVSLRWPNGAFETTLAGLFLGVSGSGVLGILLTRSIPGRLTVRGQEVIFERIPVFRRQLRDKAEELVVHCVEESDATTLADFYTEHLATFFDRSRQLWQHLEPSQRQRRRLIHDLHALDRYFSDRERTAAAELTELIETKDALDYHQALQSLLKGWLFVHIPLTYALLICSGVHLILVHAFKASTP